jgi:hypothetical protein
MTDKEKTIKELKEALDSLDITNKYRLNIIRAIEYLQEEPVSEEWIKELRTKLDSMSKEDFKKVFDKYAVDFNEEPISRESWTDKDWDDYYQALAEANEELDEEIIQDAIEMEADY